LRSEKLNVEENSSAISFFHFLISLFISFVELCMSGLEARAWNVGSEKDEL
jgi:hypothetical protein